MKELFHNPIFILLSIIIIGQTVGRIKIKSFSFGTSAIIFVALFYGYLGFTIPKVIQDFGLLFFIYSIGIEAGPGFLPSFQRDGLKLSIGAITVVTIGCACTTLTSWLWHYQSDIAAGIFAGAMTSTPSLATAVEITHSPMAAASYGLTYCFGIIGVIVFLKLSPVLFKKKISEEENELNKSFSHAFPKVESSHFEISNPNLFGKKLKDIHLTAFAPVSITRHLIKGECFAIRVTKDTILNEGDIIRIVGREEDLKKVEMLFGKKTETTIHFTGNLVRQKMIVSKKDIIGRTLASLNLTENFNIQVARVVRNGIELPAAPNQRLRIGDVLHVVGEKKSIENAVQMIGNDLRASLTTDVLSLLIGLLLGLTLGHIPLGIPNVGTIELGNSGGVLLAGLVLGMLHNTKSRLWQIPQPTNTFIRELGLMFFLASVGSSAGTQFIITLKHEGATLLVAGIIVTTFTTFLGYGFCRKILRIPYLQTLGVLAGGMTNSPALAATSDITKTNYIASAYATVYPVALLSMILYTKLIVWVWGVL